MNQFLGSGNLQCLFQRRYYKFKNMDMTILNCTSASSTNEKNKKDLELRGDHT